MNINTAALTARSQKLAQRYAEGNMIYRVRIDRPATPTFDPVMGTLTEASVSVYAGVARITPVTTSGEENTGDAPTYTQSTSVSIPIAAAIPRIDDLLTIVAHTDPALVNLVFRITGIDGGGQMPVVRRLTCVGVEPDDRSNA